MNKWQRIFMIIICLGGVIEGIWMLQKGLVKDGSICILISLVILGGFTYREYFKKS